MPSSTFSSNERLPNGPWARTWVVALALALLALGSYEGFWRLRGFVPSINDDADLWGLARSTLKGDDPQAVVGIGASRIQLGLNPAVFAEEFEGRKPVQLAVDGSSFLPVLHHLSQDESFRGVVLCDVTPRLVFKGVDPHRGVQAEYVKKYESQTALTAIERQLRLWVQLAFVLRLPDVAPQQVLWSLKKGSLPSPNYLITHVDRSKQADYTRADLRALTRKIEESYRPDKVRGVCPEQFDNDLTSLEAMVERIQQRGGQVVFVALPTSGTVRRLEDQHFPRSRYWDVLAARTRAITIHFADYPTLAHFRCPEGSHLDYRDAITFTKNFAAILKEKLLEESSVTLKSKGSGVSRKNRNSE